ncbi:hypothetical protein MF271_04085 [Deinococcus sp. KNUC1210]|uniref:hypothetical protein n=1 Tax=Deinococcus sp. KNUC1210 TaxID=2917691 RepID=UPI001EEFBC72|nr:hypothetical protein [Deinococcus sp. KNUC1210]ULH15824.1 hypothetical protein MF271_04085 [Deinococcus sp. KNUC1210]
MNAWAGEWSRNSRARQVSRALLSMYALLLLMECRTLPSILRVRPPAPDLLWVSVLLQALLLLTFCVRIVRITRLFQGAFVLTGVAAL